LNNADGSLDVGLHDVTEDDKKKVSAAAESLLASIDHDVESVVSKVLGDFDSRRVRGSTMEQLSKWCHSGASFTSAVEPACVLARTVFGVLPPRLLDQNDKRVADYNSIVESLLKQIH
jgi:hypothetical protein